MLKAPSFVLAVILTFGFTLQSEGRVSDGPETVIVSSGSLKLHALLFLPKGHGPFPAVLFNHGSGHAGGTSAGGPDRRHPELLGPVFARHGYVFLYLYRRGDGLSAGQGVPAGDIMDQTLAAKGEEARNQIQLKLLETDELSDVIAGLTYLRGLPQVDSGRIGVVGHSFGGSLTVLLAEHDRSIRAIVTFAAAGYSWDRSPQLQARLTAAVQQMTAVPFFIHAKNDFSVRAGTELAAEMQRLGKPHLVKIYPPVGQTLSEGHDFIHLRISSWEPDVFAFLDQHLSKVRANERR